MWGWSWLALLSTLNWDVFPMYVGVIPSPTFTWSPILSVPHVCGGDPKFALCLITLHQCSPCMWGWSLLQGQIVVVKIVFPMYVGVILNFVVHSSSVICVPHVCGGDPLRASLSLNERPCSPCMWGWSFEKQQQSVQFHVFPMYVGVILLGYQQYF